MLRWLFAVITAVILSAFAFLLLTGQYFNEGPVLVRLAEDHGIHRGDIFVVCGWATALLSEVGLLLTTGRRCRARGRRAPVTPTLHAE